MKEINHLNLNRRNLIQSGFSLSLLPLLAGCSAPQSPTPEKEFENAEKLLSELSYSETELNKIIDSYLRGVSYDRRTDLSILAQWYLSNNESEIEELSKNINNSLDNIDTSKSKRFIQEVVFNFVQEDFNSGDTKFLLGWLLGITEIHMCVVVLLLSEE